MASGRGHRARGLPIVGAHARQQRRHSGSGPGAGPGALGRPGRGGDGGSRGRHGCRTHGRPPAAGGGGRLRRGGPRGRHPGGPRRGPAPRRPRRAARWLRALPGPRAGRCRGLRAPPLGRGRGWPAPRAGPGHAQAAAPQPIAVSARIAVSTRKENALRGQSWRHHFSTGRALKAGAHSPLQLHAALQQPDVLHQQQPRQPQRHTKPTRAEQSQKCSGNLAMAHMARLRTCCRY
mmetsp:Transcript_47642/g.132543  ORF Transcript_47642/g.132543 Transcript_47642/m.132543 type:complete len:234 (+) Transcript_47642:1929-2630(+)